MRKCDFMHGGRLLPRRHSDRSLERLSLVGVPEPETRRVTSTTQCSTGWSASAKTSCFAVGRYFYQNSNYAYFTLIEAWNGKVWSIVSSPNPGLLDVLTGVACASSNECVAVGYHYSLELGPGYLQTMILSWNGTSWSTTNSPNLGNKYKRNSNDLEGVTCASSTYCVAVGGYSPQNNGGEKPSGIEENLIETGT